MNIKTLPLPGPDTHCYDDDLGRDIWSYSAELMRARDLQVWNLALERAFKACLETGAIKGSSDSTFDMADDCANAILKLKE